MIFEILIIILMCKFIVMNKNNTHFLLFLILIEFISLSILMNLILNNNNSWVYLIFLMFSVGEAVLGLSLMVSMSFMYGHQNIKLINLIN